MFVNSLLKNKKKKFSERFNEDMIDLSGISFRIPDNFRYKVVTVENDYIARPDLLSYHLYGDDQYGDLLCKLNGISNPFELNAGDVLVIPDFEYLDEFMYIDDYEDSIKETTNRPKAKQRNEKRTPNEAVVGDHRFKVDKTNRVIIY